MWYHVEVHQKPDVGWQKKDSRLCFYILVQSRCDELFVEVCHSPSTHKKLHHEKLHMLTSQQQQNGQSMVSRYSHVYSFPSNYKILSWGKKSCGQTRTYALLSGWVFLIFSLLHEQVPCLRLAMSKSLVAPTTCPESHLAVGAQVSGSHGNIIANPNPAIRRRVKQWIFGVVVSACTSISTMFTLIMG